jgi:hypothetical protein
LFNHLVIITKRRATTRHTAKLIVIFVVFFPVSQEGVTGKSRTRQARFFLSPPPPPRRLLNMQLTHADVTAIRLDYTTNFEWWATRLLEATPGPDTDRMQKDVMDLCARLCALSKKTLLSAVLHRLMQYNTVCESSIRALTHIEWWVRDATGSAAYYILGRLSLTLKHNITSLSVRVGVLIVQTLVPGLVYCVLVGSRLTDEPEHQEEKSISLYLSPYILEWRDAWNAAVASGSTTYAATLSTTLLASTPLAEVLVQLTMSYMCLS